MSFTAFCAAEILLYQWRTSKIKVSNEVSEVWIQIYALYFIIVLYFCEQEDDKVTNFCLSFSLIQIKFPNKYQKQREQFHKCLNFYEIIPLLPSCGWPAAWYCLFCLSLSLCFVEKCFLILQIATAIRFLKVIKDSSFKSKEWTLFNLTN